jgi:hypothetical protein
LSPSAAVCPRPMPNLVQVLAITSPIGQNGRRLSCLGIDAPTAELLQDRIKKLGRSDGAERITCNLGCPVDDRGHLSGKRALVLKL